MKNIGLCLLLVVAHASCFAQVSDSITYPQVTVTEQRIVEAIGSSVSESDTVLYKLLRSRGLTQVLETESFIATRAYSPGGIANFSVRGTGSQHTQVVWEGIPINDPMLGQTDLSTISLSGMSGVRVLYGSAGLTNNSGGIGGTIELISQSTRKKSGIDVNLNAYAGSFGLYGVSVRLRDKHGLISGTTSVEYQTARNNFTYRNLASIAKEDKKLEHAASQMIGVTRTVGVNVNEKNQLKVNFYFSQVTRELPPTMLMASTNEQLLDRDIWAALNWRRIGKRSRINVTASYIHGKQEYLDNNDYRFHHLYQANKNLIRYKLNLGYNLHLEVGGDVFNETAKSDSSYSNEPQWRFWQAAFASLKYVPKKWVSAQALIREDVIDGEFSPVQGLVGVEVKPTKWFLVKGNVSRNFRAPTLNDLYWAPGGNPDLKNETGFSWEAGLGFKTKSKNFSFRFDAAYFQSEIDNWIIWLPAQGLWIPQNKRAVSVNGVESRLQTSASFGRVLIRLNGAYSYVSSTVSEGISDSDASVGKQLIYVPKHQVKADFSVHISKLFLLYGHNLTGVRYTSSDNNSELPAFQLSYVSFGYEHKFKRHSVAVNCTIENLFNTEYQTVAWRPMPGRSFLINLNYQFL